MPKVIVESVSKDGDIGINEIVFIIDGKKYQVTPKGPAGFNKINEFHRYLRKCEKDSSRNPFEYSRGQWKKYFSIERVDGPSKAEPGKEIPPEGEQTSLFSYDWAKIARVMLKYANGNGNEANLFWDEVGNLDIKSEDAKKILDAYEKGADTEHSVAKVTGIDAYTCKKVLDLADKFNLLNP